MQLFSAMEFMAQEDCVSSTAVSPGSRDEANHSDASAVKKRGGRSCQVCHQRKVRCDKKMPSCSRCYTADKPCVYPAPGPRFRRTKQAMREERQARLAAQHGQAHLFSRAEQPLTYEYSSRGKSKSGRLRVKSLPHAVSDTEPQQEDITGSLTSTDFLLQQGSLSHYFNDVVLSRVLNEVNHSHVSGRISD